MIYIYIYIFHQKKNNKKYSITTKYFLQFNSQDCLWLVQINVVRLSNQYNQPNHSTVRALVLWTSCLSQHSATCMTSCCCWVTTITWGWSTEALELNVKNRRVSHSWYMCVVGHGYGGLRGGRNGWYVCRVNLGRLVACWQMPEHIPSVRRYTDDTRSDRLPGVQLGDRLSQNLSVFQGSS